MSTTEEIKTCGLCGRELGTVNIDYHHLIPKTFKGKATDENLVPMHKSCHRAIHAMFQERELLNYYHTFERLLEREDIQNFVKWIQKKPIEYYVGTDETKERKGKRFR